MTTTITTQVNAADTNANAIRLPFQRKEWRAVSRRWLIFGTEVGGTTKMYYTSAPDSDRTNWATPTYIRDAGAVGVSVWWDGTYAHIYDAGSLTYNRGTCSGSTLTLSDDIVGDVGVDKSFRYQPGGDMGFCVDSNGKLVVSYQWTNVTQKTVRVAISTKSHGTIITDGTWGAYADDEVAAANHGTNAPIVGTILPGTSGNLELLYTINAASAKVKGNSWDGDNWDTPADVSTTAVEFDLPIGSLDKNIHPVSAIMNGDIVEMVFTGISGSDSPVIHMQKDGTWSGETTLDADSSEDTSPLICRDGDDDLIVFWIESDHIYYKRRIADSWDESATDWVDDSGMGITNERLLACEYAVEGSAVQVYWMSDHASENTWNIRTDTLDFGEPVVGPFPTFFNP